MPFDDEDLTLGAPALTPSAGDHHGGGTDDAPSLEDALGDEMQDFRLFSSLFDKKQASGKTLRRGEKDFESHGTRAQEGALEASRTAMHEVLSYTRRHKPKDHTRAWYFPDKWVDVPAEEEREGEKGAGLFARERVVAVESEIKGPLGQNTGRVVTGLEGYKHTPGWLKTWLLPEEALYMVERGSLDLWWPARGIEDIFLEKKVGEEGDDADKEFEDYELGIPLSFQAVYSLLIGADGERGKVSLEKYQVYANLRRTGYKVMRATLMPLPPPTPPKPPYQALWEWLFTLVLPSKNPQSSSSSHPSYGPLVKPGLYRSYNQIFSPLALLPRHKPTPHPSPSTPAAEEPFNIHYDVWKSSTPFPKTKPPPPEFRIAVVDARDSAVPTLQQMTALLERCTPWDPPEQPNPNQKGGRGGGQQVAPGQVYRRLKHGWRNAVVAVVDRGIISFVRFGEMAFGEERLFERIGGGGGGRGRGRGK
ncbi:tRNA-splicing endonuclease subunit sen54 N-term-domain-containing protein [Hypoxylon fragiforme]|uniref:tRNA-splicing endonuclease subunit sen54 N-term-domain-containing protein n=1 Tax=Hypoxylon fragiforme TaxID=63214 RepID=UPI0020C5EE68|nr:tRNA-splicing endonuclease subunit sen54 N-term-domain-containing protein [Hypoxylon fragiforme]KAI2610727.1 tRNA-splicing endonuclease subunit sen54 N-term-domain-containing protein [Hypoxylon fragiforme]